MVRAFCFRTPRLLQSAGSITSQRMTPVVLCVLHWGWYFIPVAKAADSYDLHYFKDATEMREWI